MRPPEVSTSGRLVPPLGPEVHREEGVVPNPRIWDYMRGVGTTGCAAAQQESWACLAGDAAAAG